jgi:hypothetical protein
VKFEDVGKLKAKKRHKRALREVSMLGAAKFVVLFLTAHSTVMKEDNEPISALCDGNGQKAISEVSFLHSLGRSLNP